MARTKRPIKWNAGAVLVLLLGLGAVGVSTHLTLREYHLGAAGVRAIGTVTKYEKRGKSVYWTITFPHQGQSVSAVVEPSMFSGLELERQVPVLVDPQNPQTINVDRFLHRYFYQALGFALGALMLAVLPMLLWQGDDAWLREHVVGMGGADAESRARADRFAAAFYFFDLASGSAPKGAFADYYRTYGEKGWAALKAAWDREAVPSLEPVVAEIDRVIAAGDPVVALVAASPGIEKFYYPRRAKILEELRDYVTEAKE